jgi:ABC-type lipoprotein release transport system permease subunit
MRRLRSLPVLALRRMLGNWRLLSSVVVGTLAAAAIISATAIYSDAIRDLGLQFALEQRPPQTLDVHVDQSNVPISSTAYRASRARVDSAVAASLQQAAGGLVRQGRSATFFPAPPGRPADRDDPDRLRGNLYFRSDIEQHVELVAGEWPRALERTAEGPIPAALGEETALRLGIELGERFDLHPFWDERADPIEVVVTGLIRALDLEARYWGGAEDVVDARQRSWETLHLLVPESSFFGVVPHRLASTAADYRSIYGVRFEGLDARNAVPVANALSTLERRLSASETRTRVSTALIDVLRTYDQKLFFTRIPLLVLLLQIGGIVAYYLVMVSTMLVERQAAEIATLRSRGATTAQLLAQYGVEGGILALLAALAGPPIAGAVISALGPTPAFRALSDGGPLDVHISTASYVLAGLGALIAFAALMIPAWRATRTTVVEFKRASARPRPTPLFLKYYLDVGLVLVLALVFWRLSQEDRLFTRTLFGETQVDPFLLATPAVFMLTVGIVFLRIFPLVLRGFAWLLGRTRSVAVLVGMRSLVRNPTHYTRLILLLMFATGVGMFGATFSATLDQSYEDRAGYAVGADARAEDLRTLSGQGDRALLEAIESVPAEVASPAIRVDGYVETSGASESVEFLAVEPSTFGQVAYFRDDFSETALPEMLSTLEANRGELQGVPLPPDTRQLGVWLKVPDIRGPFSVLLDVRDATGRTLGLGLAFPRPGDPVTEEWRFFAADLEHPVNRYGSALREAQLEPPLSLHGIFIVTNSRIAAQRGVMQIGPAFATAEAPPPPAERESEARARELDAVFPGATPVTDFSAPAFEVIQGFRPFTIGDRALQDREAPPGAASSIRYQWLDARLSPSVRGLRQATDGQPVLFYLSQDAAQRLQLEPGDFAVLSVSSRYVRGQLAGVFDLFPTYQAATSREGFAVTEASRLLAAVNASPPDRLLTFSEAWFASTDPPATREAASEMLGAQHAADVESEMLRQQEDPLVAAGWAGILAISFGAVLLLAAIGFVVYSYLTAQERSLEFAILRTLGFSRPQVFFQVLFEHVLVIAAGMGLGTLVGLRVGRLMMGFLTNDERGIEVLPPFILAVSWPEVFLVWGILGAVFVVTIGAVVLLYLRLAVHRALRIGDV